MPATDTLARRLVNCQVLIAKATPFGTEVAEAFGGAYGRPEDAAARAAVMAGPAHAAARAAHGYRVLGIVATDVRTGEVFASPVAA